MIELLKEMVGEKLWISCGDNYYLGVLKSIGNDTVVMSDARLWIMDHKANLTPSFLEGRDVSFRVCKISSAIQAQSGDEEIEFQEIDEYDEEDYEDDELA